MANSFYTPTGKPTTQARGKSLDIRAEFALVGVGFDTVQSGFVTNGVIFPAVQVPSANANTLDDYEEAVATGSWVPADSSGAGLVLTSLSGQYIKVGRLVFVQGQFSMPATANGATMAIGGLPFAQNNQSASLSVGQIGGGTSDYTQVILLGTATPAMQFSKPGTIAVNSNFSSLSVYVSGCYIASA